MEANLVEERVDGAIGSLAEFQNRGLRWPWEQLLRAMAPHQGTLRFVYLIGSTGPAGSHPEVATAAAMVEHLLPDVRVVAAPPVDFRDFDRLVDAIVAGISRLRSELGAAERELIVDVTGGFKTTSIAGAVVTLNRNVPFQYVPTSGAREPIAYDLSIRSGGPL